MKKINLILSSEEAKNQPLTLTNKPADPKLGEGLKKEQVRVEEFSMEETPDKDGNVSLPKDIIAALISMASKGKKGGSDEREDKLERTLNRLAEAFEQSKQDDGSYLGQRPIDMHDIDFDDVLPVPAFFFSHSISYMIFDDKRFGRTISTPYKRAFKFKKVHRVVSQSAGSKVPNYLSVSAVVVRSKKEYEWLKQHTLFGIKFFEKLGENKDISSEMQDKLVTAWNIISSFDEHAVVQRCIKEGIPVDSLDSAELKRRLAQKMAKNMMKDADQRSNKYVQELQDFQDGNIKVIDLPKTGNEIPAETKVQSPTY